MNRFFWSFVPMFFSIYLGICIYASCRSTFIPFNQYIRKYSVDIFLFSVYPICKYEWVIYNLVDGLWMFSFSLFYLYAFSPQKILSNNTLAWVLRCLPFFIGVIVELSQYFHFLLRGTFDILDIIFYFIFSIFAFIWMYSYKKY